MSHRIKVTFKRNGQVLCTNTSREKVAIEAPGWESPIVVRPNHRFSGDYANQKTEVIAPVIPPSWESVEYPSAVRRATEADIDELLLIVPQLWAETSVLPPSLAKAQAFVERCASREGGAIAGIIDGPDGIDGTIGLDVTESETSDHRYVRAVWLGLHPHLRNNPPLMDDPRRNHGRRLFDFARWYHGGLEKAAGHPILMQFDITTLAALGPKIGYYERNAVPMGAIFGYMSDKMFLAQSADAV